jgi:hypothetical protein
MIKSSSISNVSAYRSEIRTEESLLKTCPHGEWNQKDLYELILTSFYKQLFNNFLILRNRKNCRRYKKAAACNSYSFSVGEIGTCCQFHEHFTSSFSVDFLAPKHLNLNCKYWKATRLTFVQKAAHKMLEKYWHLIWIPEMSKGCDQKLKSSQSLLLVAVGDFESEDKQTNKQT